MDAGRRVDCSIEAPGPAVCIAGEVRRFCYKARPDPYCVCESKGNKGLEFTLMNDGAVSSTKSFTKNPVRFAPPAVSYDNAVTTTYIYERWDDARQSLIRVSNSNYNPPGYSDFKYDVNGHLKSAIDSAAGRSFTYITDSDGQILRRDEALNGTWNINTGTVQNPTTVRQHQYLNFAGSRVGDIGNDGIDTTDYAQVLARDLKPDPNAKALDRFKRFTPVMASNFDTGTNPINDLYPSAAPGNVTVRDGDTLQSIAQSQWGDASLWYLLADANGLTGSETLTAGMVLNVPSKVANLHNNTGTFKVYDAGKAIGDTGPTLPDPPPANKGCGGFGVILALVVAVVVTVITEGATSEWLQQAFEVTAEQMAAQTAAAVAINTASAVVGAAAGSIASQGVLIATGNQDHFSWKQVGQAALTAFFAPGGGQAKTIGEALLQAAQRGVINQGIGLAMGTQKHFDWKALAASTIAGGVAYGINNAIGQAQYGDEAWGTLQDNPAAAKVRFSQDIGNTLVRGIASGLGAGLASAAVRGGSVTRQMPGILQDVIGSTIGNIIADRMVVSGRIDAMQEASRQEAVARYDEHVAAQQFIPPNYSASITDEQIADWFLNPSMPYNGGGEMLASNAGPSDMSISGLGDKLKIAGTMTRIQELEGQNAYLKADLRREKRAIYIASENAGSDRVSAASLATPIVERTWTISDAAAQSGQFFPYSGETEDGMEVGSIQVQVRPTSTASTEYNPVVETVVDALGNALGGIGGVVVSLGTPIWELAKLGWDMGPVAMTFSQDARDRNMARRDGLWNLVSSPIDTVSRMYDHIEQRYDAIGYDSNPITRGYKAANLGADVTMAVLGGAQGVRSIASFGSGQVARIRAPQLAQPALNPGVGAGRIELAKNPSATGNVAPIGKSGYRSIGEFTDAVTAKYQSLYDQGYSIAEKMASQGRIQNTARAIGSKTDEFARVGLRDWLTNVEGIEEGAGRIIQVNRRLYDPSGSGAYRVPDVYIPGSQTILDGSISFKTSASLQIIDFRNFSGGARTTIMAPTSPNLQWGSYGIIH